MSEDCPYNQLLEHPYDQDFPGVLGDSRRKRGSLLTLTTDDGADLLLHGTDRFFFGFYGGYEGQHITDERYLAYAVDVTTQGLFITRFVLDEDDDLEQWGTMIGFKHESAKRSRKVLWNFGHICEKSRTDSFCPEPPRQSRDNLVDRIWELTK